ncbi:MAG: hypothetical protein II388_00520, partial [Clostridia bacterium]|nr:hypothetical protein [Clostridia bacterium]
LTVSITSTDDDISFCELSAPMSLIVDETFFAEHPVTVINKAAMQMILLIVFFIPITSVVLLCLSYHKKLKQGLNGT